MEKMSNKRFRAIMIPILSVLLVMAIVVTVVANVLGSTLDQFVGRGERHVIVPEGTENWDLDYYGADGETKEEAKEHSFEVANKVVEEGVILLKNNGVLPLAKDSTVTPFGYRYVSPIYSQMASGGSAKWMVGNEITPAEALGETFTINNAAVEKMEQAGTPEGVLEAPGTLAAAGAGSVLGGDNIMYEYPGSLYDDVKADGSVGLVFIGRPGQEGTDKKYDGYADGTPHSLALTANEKATIAAAKRICDKVVLVSESAAPMELAPVMSGELEVDAILWISQVGERGFSVVDDILCGDVNPSGRTVDIFATDFTKDPTYQNFGSYHYDNATVTVSSFGNVPTAPDGTNYRTFVEYQEGIYMGYRYYETADAVDDAFVYGELDGAGAVLTPGAVAYPFGYGLSYTTFEQEITDFSDFGDDITLTVEVKNTGDAAGKEVVQVYYTSPYTKYDAENGIEKSATVLAAFAKTEEIPAGGSASVTLTFAKEDMASYSYAHQNKDGTRGCYILEAGEYAVELKKNSHDVIDSRTVTISSTKYFEGEDLRESDRDAQSALDEDGNPLPFPAAGADAEYKAVSNLFQDSTDYMLRTGIFSRSDWEGTFPHVTSRVKSADAETLALFEGNIENNFDPLTDPEYGNVPGSKVYAEEAPVSGADNGLSLIDMRGKDYYDENWDLLLDQIDWEGNGDAIITALCGCAYNSPAIEEIGLPLTSIQDGVNGIKVPAITDGYDMEQSATFGMMPLLSATWNVDLIEEVGEAIGREGLAHEINGLYAPALNLHRSPFGGRVFEYFSEDPLLTGKLAKAWLEGAASVGMTTYIKHFAGNDQETNRDKLGSTWADEQTMRELYFKAFEIPVKEAMAEIDYIADADGNHATRTIRACTGIMSAQMNLGAIPGHANWALQQDLLRGEWGFLGTITTDYWFWPVNNLRDLIFRTGGDIYLCMGIPGLIDVVDKTSPTALNVFREKVKNLSYTVVNSSAMQGMCAGAIITYGMSPWAVWLLIGDIVIGAVIAGGVLWIVLRQRDENKHPERYKKIEKI